MLAHNVLIITSGLAGKMSPDALDRAIKQLVWMKKVPILVLGSDGDDVMRMCQQMDSCEMVFDPNGVSEFSPVKAGLHATDAPAYLWRPSDPFPEPATWRALESVIRYGQFSNFDLLKFEDDQSGLFLTTAKGTKHLKSRPAEAAWPLSDDLSIQIVTLADLKAE
jgi:hypothetical protein